MTRRGTTTTRRPVRRVAGRVVMVVLLGLLAGAALVTPGAPGGAQGAPAAGEPAGRLRLVEQTPWVTPNGEFRARLAIEQVPTGATLSADNFLQLWIPPGFAHGFSVLSETAEVEYKCTEIYVREDEIAIAWNDPEIGIAWPVSAPLLSPRDRAAVSFAAARERLASLR